MFGVSENTGSTADAGDGVEQANGAASEGDGFKPITSQEELDRIIQPRIARVKAKFEGFDEFKAAAERAKELEAANVDLQSKVERFEQAEARSALVRKVAENTGVDADILADLRADSEDELTVLASKLRDRFKASAPLIPGQEKRPDAAPLDPLRQAASQLFQRS